MVEDIETAYTRGSDPATSLAAADSVHVRKQMAHLLDTLAQMHAEHSLPADDTQICAFAHNRLGYMDSEQGLRSRRHEAEKAEWVEYRDSDGTSPTGRHAARWDITPAGLAMAHRLFGGEQ